MKMISFHVITTIQHPERQTRVEKMLISNNISNFTFHYFDTIKPAWKGCYNSHYKMIEYAKKEKMPYIAILEDNCDLVRPVTLLNDLMDFITKNDSWDIIYIGGFITPFSNISEKVEKSIFKTKQTHGTSSYIISERAYSKVPKDSSIPIDCFYSGNLNQYIFKPFIFYRKSNLNSIVNPHLDFLRKLYFCTSFHKIIEELFFKGYLQIFSILFLSIILYLIYYIYGNIYKRIIKP